jgi:hypothetical protein
MKNIAVSFNMLHLPFFRDEFIVFILFQFLSKLLKLTCYIVTSKFIHIFFMSRTTISRNVDFTLCFIVIGIEM